MLPHEDAGPDRRAPSDPLTHADGYEAPRGAPVPRAWVRKLAIAVVGILVLGIGVGLVVLAASWAIGTVVDLTEPLR